MEVQISFIQAVCRYMDVYQQTYDQPVSITIDGAKLGYVYGLSNGALNTDSSKTALTLRIKNGATIGTVTGAENAAVEGSVAVEAGDGCSLSALYAVKTAGVSGDVSLNLKAVLTMESVWLHQERRSRRI